MSILLTKDTRAVIQGISGKIGSVQAMWMKKYGTNIVAGVTPGKGGIKIEEIPVCDDVAETVEKYGANAAVLFVPAPFAKDAVLEAVDAGIKLIVCVPEHIPVNDTLLMRAKAQEKGVILIGPNTPGIISPGIGKLGIMPANMFNKGGIGLISRSGTLSYEVAGYINEAGYGESTMIGIGGDQIRGTDASFLLKEFEEDPETDMVVLVGEIGGSFEEDAAAFAKTMKKPVIAFIAGKNAPAGKRMGHAGAIITGHQGTVESKTKALREAGVMVAERIPDITSMIHKIYGK
ncbi:succinate--CoA ligase subunit alpha [Candidatus Formimonas warabiya]|uniref:Succinate--CoA ligase [ADP-forming] subunit alpha n=1 Tax=Formimonas warabiya TaxID=1761012 RepID=A0A3G1KM13_FORW1|nr:succinate--CoA ligase subunit alpha [Candidatus Formimonas warabiya]ATW23470.1 succinate--CoA ligase subunit alpha [Candidatus Formimonas warabiya]